jgi:predicted enzyme related to lactoylglutathione lyase
MSAAGNGSIGWIDIGVRDRQRAAVFYGSLFGWASTRSAVEGYDLFVHDGTPVAGLGAAADAGTPYWTVALHTLDAVATAHAVVAAGGAVVVPPARVADAAVAATVRDPAGATFGLWQPIEGPLPQASAAAIGFRLSLTDRVGAQQFWGAVMGWEFRDDGHVRRADVRLGSWFGCGPRELPGARSGPSPWIVEFPSASVDADLQRVTALGGAIVDAEHGVVADPEGAVFALVP